MKHYLATILLAIGVAATPSISFCEEGVEPPYGYYDPGDGGQPIGLYTIEQFQAAMQQAKAAVDEISSAAAKQKEQINTLWEEAKQLVDGLKEDIGKLDKLVELSDSENGFVTTDALNEWINGEYADKISEIEESLKTKKDKDDDDDPEDLSDYAKKSDLTDYAKKSDLNDYAKESELSDYAKKTELNDYAKKSDLSDYLKTSDAQSTYATKETTNNHETRITALENRPGGGGGGGCDDNCRESWHSVFDFFGEDVATIDEAQGTGSCHRVTFSGTALEWLMSFPIAYVGSDFSYGIEAQSMWDDDLKPTFPVSDEWAGSGLEVDENGALKVSVDGSASGTLGGTLDGTDATDAAGIVAYDADGNFCALDIGSISPGNPDGETIGLTEAGEGEVPALCVLPEGICDGETIGVDENGKLYSMSSGGGSPVDNASITTNASQGAVSDGVASLVGYSSATAGKTPVVTGTGSSKRLEWKDNDNYTAGTGISITTSQSTGKNTISSTDTGTYTVITYVSDVRWDSEKHQLIMTKTTATVKMTGTPTTQEKIILVAASHMSDHDGEDE